MNPSDGRSSARPPNHDARGGPLFHRQLQQRPWIAELPESYAGEHAHSHRNEDEDANDVEDERNSNPGSEDARSEPSSVGVDLRIVSPSPEEQGETNCKYADRYPAGDGSVCPARSAMTPVNRSVVCRAVVRSAKRSSKSPSESARGYGIRALKPSAASRSTTTIARSLSSEGIDLFFDLVVELALEHRSYHRKHAIIDVRRG
jgi:hypothetical protein